MRRVFHGGIVARHSDVDILTKSEPISMSDQAFAGWTRPEGPRKTWDHGPDVVDPPSSRRRTAQATASFRDAIHAMVFVDRPVPDFE